MKLNDDLVPPSVGLPRAWYKRLEAWPGACQVIPFAWKRVVREAS